MSDHHDDDESDVSNADVTLFKNKPGAGPPSSEVGLELNTILTTSSSVRSPPDTPKRVNSVATQRQRPLLLPNSSISGTPQPSSSATPQQPTTHRIDIGVTQQQDKLMDMSMLSSSMGGVPPQFFMQMMQMMQKMSDRLCIPPAETKVRIKDVYLPSFDPDTNVGIREWCQHINKAVETYKLNDFDIRMKVGSLLKGRAKMWVDDWMVTTSTWEELRNNLITTFEPENRYSRDIVRFREHVYDSSKDIAEFLSQAWVLWRRVTKNKLDNEEAVEAVIGCVNDERLRIELLNSRATTVPELISVASTIRKKRAHPDSNSAMPSKRPRFSTNIAGCQICKRTNHTSSDCRYKTPEAKPQQGDKDSKSINPTTCTFCKKPGHTYEVCFKRQRSITQGNIS